MKCLGVKYLIMLSVLGTAFLTLSPEVALACHDIGIPSVPGLPGSPECNAAAAAEAPEIGATGGLAALAAVGAIAMLMLERRKNR